jgi:hypothetical protein
MIVENFLELVDIEDITLEEEYVNMVDISVDVDQSFLLSNGLISHNSASSAFRKYRDTETQGAYSLKGKFVNVSELTTNKLLSKKPNGEYVYKEVVDMMGALGLKLGQKVIPGTLRYGRILIYTDADCLEENTLIITKHGEKKIKDITYEDLILTHTGEYKKVKNIIEKDVSNYIKIKVNGNSIICSENHKLMIFRDGNIMELKAMDIKYTDYFLLKK